MLIVPKDFDLVDGIYDIYIIYICQFQFYAVLRVNLKVNIHVLWIPLESRPRPFAARPPPAPRSPDKCGSLEKSVLEWEGSIRVKTI